MATEPLVVLRLGGPVKGLVGTGKHALALVDHKGLLQQRQQPGDCNSGCIPEAETRRRSGPRERLLELRAAQVGCADPHEHHCERQGSRVAPAEHEGVPGSTGGAQADKAAQCETDYTLPPEAVS